MTRESLKAATSTVLARLAGACLLAGAAAAAAQLTPGTERVAPEPRDSVPRTAPRPAPVVVVQLRGVIGPKDLPRLRAAFEQARTDVDPAGALLLLDSEGGDGLAAMEIGRMTRAARAHVLVIGRCASACALALAGGVLRAAPDGHVGIHRGRIARLRAGRASDDLSDEERSQVAQMLEVAERQVREYLTEMGLPGMFAAMQGVAHDRTLWLDAAAQARLGLTGADPEWLRQEAPRLAGRYGITPDALIERAGRSTLICAPVTDAHEFVRCYRRVLRTGI